MHAFESPAGLILIRSHFSHEIYQMEAKLHFSIKKKYSPPENCPPEDNILAGVIGTQRDLALAHDGHPRRDQTTSEPITFVATFLCAKSSRTSLMFVGSGRWLPRLLVQSQCEGYSH
jgi:hypothetical protein